MQPPPDTPNPNQVQEQALSGSRKVRLGRLGAFEPIALFSDSDASSATAALAGCSAALTGLTAAA